MKDKNPGNLDLSEVLAEIQSFLDDSAPWGSPAPESPENNPAPLGISDTSRSRLPASLTVTQYYLSRHRRENNAELLETLPNDMFIVC